MHTPILLAVEASDVDEAINFAEGFAEASDWSDWSEQAGRFAEKQKSVVRYSDDPEEFMRLVEDYQGAMEDEVRRLLDGVGHLTISELVINPKYRLWDFDTEEPTPLLPTSPVDKLNDKMAVYSAHKLLRLTAGYFTPETHFWDVSWGTRNIKNLKERIEENPEGQFVIVWDFHF